MKASPIKLATGAKVMYLLLISISITFFPSTNFTSPSSIGPAASEPLLGPVNPKQGINSPSSQTEVFFF